MKVSAYIYGAGDNGIALADILTDCQFDVRAFIDRDEKKWGVCEVGENKTQIQCLGIEDALKKDAAKELVFVTVKYDSDQVKEYLSGKGFEKIVIGNNYHNIPISHIMKHFLPEPSEMGSWEGCYPFGRYDSAYPSLRSLGKEPSTDREIFGIDFNLERQAELVSQMEKIVLPGWSNEIGHGGGIVIITKMDGLISPVPMRYIIL